MNLYFRSDKPNADGSIEVYHINRIQEVLGHEMYFQLMFIHAMTGSDRTSRIFGVGKKTAFQYLAKGDPVLRSCAIAFTIPNQRTEVIDNLGCQAMAVLFGGNQCCHVSPRRGETERQKYILPGRQKYLSALVSPLWAETSQLFTYTALFNAFNSRFGTFFTLHKLSVGQSMSMGCSEGLHHSPASKGLPIKALSSCC